MSTVVSTVDEHLKLPTIHQQLPLRMAERCTARHGQYCCQQCMCVRVGNQCFQRRQETTPEITLAYLPGVVDEQGNSGGKTSSALGLLFLLGSLICDGVTGGAQDKLKMKAASAGVKAKPYDMMLWTNFYMCVYAVLAAMATGELFSG